MTEYSLTLSDENGHVDLIFDEKEIYVDLIFVDQDARRQGIARRLMEQVKGLSDICGLPLRLNARSDNVPDDEWIAFFESIGFTLHEPEAWANEMRMD